MNDEIEKIMHFVHSNQSHHHIKYTLDEFMTFVKLFSCREEFSKYYENYTKTSLKSY